MAKNSRTKEVDENGEGNRKVTYYISLDRKDFRKIPEEWEITEGGFDPGSINCRPLEDPMDPERGLMKIELGPGQAYGFVMPKDMKGGLKANHKKMEKTVADQAEDDKFWINRIKGTFAEEKPDKQKQIRVGGTWHFRYRY